MRSTIVAQANRHPGDPDAADVPWSVLNRAELAGRAARTLSASPRPFVRWAGSKQRLLSQLVEHLPVRFKTYYEPFLGAGSMYFLLQPERARLNDSCAPLMAMYETVRSAPERVLDALDGMDVLDREYYYRVRASQSGDRVEEAARFLYLNRASWNGLYRVNARGQFNVPYGRPKSPVIVERQHLVDAASQLRRGDTRLTTLDFEDALEGAGEGDLVFLDPPYASSKRREGFVDYNATLFTWEDQERLARVADRLSSAGAHVIVTNAYNTAIRALYPGFREHALVRRSSLASDTRRRRPVAESVLVS